jgi:ATP-dependent Clp protease protease subunit
MTPTQPKRPDLSMDPRLAAVLVANGARAVAPIMAEPIRLPAPRFLAGRVMADARRPAPIAGPGRRDVAALAKPDAFDRWTAGLRAAAPGDNVITMYEVIGEDWWTGGGVTVAKVDQQLNAIGAANPVEVHINSPGGDMFEGIAIYNRLLEHKGAITVKVMGLAASAASIIAMAGQQVLIGPASFLMIHNCWVVAMGDRHALADVATWLEPFDQAMAGVYATRSGQSAADIAAWMDAETWMNGQLAVERGFANGLLSEADIAEDADASAKARDTNAVRAAEINLCRAGASRTEARALIAKIKGTPGAAPTAPTPGAGDLAWLGQAAELTQALRTF